MERYVLHSKYILAERTQFCQALSGEANNLLYLLVIAGKHKNEKLSLQEQKGSAKSREGWDVVLNSNL